MKCVAVKDKERTEHIESALVSDTHTVFLLQCVLLFVYTHACICVCVWLCVVVCLCCHAEPSCTMNVLREPKGHTVLSTSAWPTPQQQSSTMPSDSKQETRTWTTNILHPISDPLCSVFNVVGSTGHLLNSQQRKISLTSMWSDYPPLHFCLNYSLIKQLSALNNQEWAGDWMKLLKCVWLGLVSYVAL